MQRDAPIPVWGWADPGEKMTVAFAGRQKLAVTDATGKWTVRLGKVPVNTHPQTLTITGKNTLTVNDVLVGDVWLCSGQSNMTYRLGFD